MAHFTSSARNIAWRLELPSPQLVSRWKSHFPIRWWCNVLSLVISQGPSTVEEGSADMLTASLLETIISAGSIVRPTSTAGRVHCLYRGLGCGGWGFVRTAAPRQVWAAAHAAKVNDRMLRQTLRSSLVLRCSFWGGPVGGCCPQVEVAVAGTILMKN